MGIFTEEKKEETIKTEVVDLDTKKNLPIKTFRAKTLNVSIWENKQEDGSKTYSIASTRSYRDKNGDWQKSNHLFERDLLAMAALLNQAWLYINNEVKQADDSKK